MELSDPRTFYKSLDFCDLLAYALIWNILLIFFCSWSFLFIIYKLLLQESQDAGSGKF